jgi:hypothetical protein
MLEEEGGVVEAGGRRKRRKSELTGCCNKCNEQLSACSCSKHPVVHYTCCYENSVAGVIVMWIVVFMACVLWGHRRKRKSPGSLSRES